MPLITFVAYDDSRTEVHAEVGSSLMKAALDNGVVGIEAECGGACSCATCHCYVDDTWQPLLVAPSELEQDMLECVGEPQPNSRLSCQIVITPALDGLVVKLPASQYRQVAHCLRGYGTEPPCGVAHCLESTSLPSGHYLRAVGVKIPRVSCSG